MDDELLQMLLNLHKKSWIDGLKLDEYRTHCCGNENVIKDMLELAKNYNKVICWHLFFCLIYALTFVISRSFLLVVCLHG